MPPDVTIVVFVNEVKIVAVGKYLDNVTQAGNTMVITVPQWLSSVGLQLTDHKPKAVLVSRRKARESITLAVGNCGIPSSCF